MLTDLKLRSPEALSEIWICPNAQMLILEYRQAGFLSKEAGGILLGYRRGPHIEVLEATAPMRKDIRGRNSFERKDSGHQSLSDKRWEASDGTILYLGEWHTHPTNIPEPSTIDRHEWDKLKRCYQDPLLFLIAGTSHWYVEYLYCHWIITSPK